jgi:hypothetical protein
VGQRSDYFSLSAAALVVAAAVSGISANFYTVAQTTKAPYSLWTSSGMIVAYVLTAVAVLLIWLGATNRPFPPWKQIRFPNLSVDVRQIQANAKDPKALWLAFGLAITNHETTQSANLTIYYRARVASGKLRSIHPKGEDWGETPFVSPGDDPPPIGFPSDWLGWTVNILPQHTASGYYVAKLDNYWREALINPAEESLLIQDLVSSRAIFVPAHIGKGPYDSSNWGIPTKDPSGFWTVYPT